MDASGPTNSGLNYFPSLLTVFQPYILAVVVPDEEVLMSWAQENNVTKSFKELCEDKVWTSSHWHPLKFCFIILLTYKYFQEYTGISLSVCPSA